MAIIPMKQTVRVYRSTGTDGWGTNVIETVYEELKCRYQDGVDREYSAIRDMDDLVMNGKFVFDKYPDIKLSDTIEYTDERGNTRSFEPRNIDVIRHISGKPLMTVVLV
jgi:hypothetical protein